MGQTTHERSHDLGARPDAGRAPTVHRGSRPPRRSAMEPIEQLDRVVPALGRPGEGCEAGTARQRHPVQRLHGARPARPFIGTSTASRTASRVRRSPTSRRDPRCSERSREGLRRGDEPVRRGAARAADGQGHPVAASVRDTPQGCWSRSWPSTSWCTRGTSPPRRARSTRHPDDLVAAADAFAAADRAGDARAAGVFGPEVDPPAHATRSSGSSRSPGRQP